MPDAPDPSQLHRAYVQTDQPIESVHVKLAEPGGERWFKFLRSIVRDGTWASLHARHQSLLVVMLELRDDETGLAYAPAQPTTAPNGQPHKGLLALSGLAEPTIRQAIREMCIMGLLARAGADLYFVVPGRVFAGRKADAKPDATASPPPPSSGHTRCHGIENDATASRTGLRSKETRARQPNQEKTERDLGFEPADENQESDRKRFIHPRLAGWQGYGLFWDLKGITDVREALGLLRVGGWLLEATAKLPRLTVAEIAEWVEKLNHDPSIRNRPVMLCRRLHEARGLAAPQPPQAGSVTKHIPDDVRRLIEIQQKRRFGG